MSKRIRFPHILKKIRSLSGALHSILVMDHILVADDGSLVVKKWGLAPGTPRKTKGILIKARCLSPFFHNLSLVELEPDVLEAKLEAFLSGLSPGLVYILLAVYRLGGGSFEPGSFLDAYEQVSDRFPNHRRALTELLEDPPYLSCRLDYGLKRLARAGIKRDLYFAGTWLTNSSGSASNP